MLNRKKTLLLIELIFFFIIVPVLLTKKIILVPKIVLIFLAGSVIIISLFKTKDFNRSRLIKSDNLNFWIKKIFLRYFYLTPLLILVVLIFEPESLLNFPLRYPWRWLLVMIFYPIISAYPQEIIFRGFIFHRYSKLFPNERYLIILSAILFSFTHIIYLNIFAVGFSLVGGFIFAKTYRDSGSILIAAIEHALYGCTIFTIGLGQYFYSG